MSLADKIEEDFSQESIVRYKDYCNNLDLSIEEVYSGLLPIVKIVMIKVFHEVEESLVDDLRSAACDKLYLAVSEKWANPTFENHKIFNFFYSVIRNSMYTELRQYNPSVYDYFYQNQRPPNAQILRYRDVECDLYLKQIAKAMRTHVEDTCRFYGVKLDACIYILNRIASGKSVAFGRLRNKYQVGNCQFYVDYVKVLVRRFFYERLSIKEYESLLEREDYHYVLDSVVEDEWD